MTEILLLAGCLLAGVTVGIGLIMAHPDTTPAETQQAGNAGAVVFLAFLLLAALGGWAVFGGSTL